MPLTPGVRGVATNGNSFGILPCERCHQPHLGRCGPDIPVIDESLSYRKNQVIFLLCEGKSNNEMAEELGLSEETIKRHLADIFEKCGKESRLRVALYYVGIALRARVTQLEMELADVKKRAEMELAQERTIVGRLESALRREAAITDAFVRNKRMNNKTSNPRVRHWLQRDATSA